MAKKAKETDLFDKPLDAPRHVYTVSQITADVKVIMENTFSGIWVEGEVSNFRPSSSGHFYFSLKDEACLLQAVAFSRIAKDIKFKLEDGLKVVCFGNIEVYGPAGKYQLIIEKVEPKGIGGLSLALEQLKEKLEKEGLFSLQHKRPIPHLPSTIGIVTSASGAAIKDILKVLERRFKDVHIIINPVKVQGDGAKEEIAQAIKEFNVFNKTSAGLNIDVMIVGRGGGSIEDLWAFNEEIVARAIYESEIPVISAVGHERDQTIADLVADVRAATPSVAAELVLPQKEELTSRVMELSQGANRALADLLLNLEGWLSDICHRLNLSMSHAQELSFNRLETTIKKLSLLNPASRINQYQEKLENTFSSICLRMNHLLALHNATFTKAAEKLSSLSPLNILGRGYSITFGLTQGQIIKSSAALKKGDIIKTKLHKGEIVSRVEEVI